MILRGLIYVAVTAVATWLVQTSLARDAANRTGGDFIQFWCAGDILLHGGNPYDYELQASHSRAVGWDRQTHGHGRFDFMPYYYPPWLGLCCVALVPLGFTFAHALWIVLQFEAAVLSGWLLRRAGGGLSPLLCVVLVAGFALTIQATRMGQIAPLVLLLAVAMWHFAEHGADRRAGWMLAALSIKPQLTAVLIAAVLLWAVRQRRWRIIEGFATAMFVFLTASTIVFPGWLPAMLHAPQEVPLVTLESPWLGVTWWSLLKTLGLNTPWAVPAWLAVNVASAVIILRAAWSRGTELLPLASLSLMAAWLLAPYARSYDLVVLLLPAIWLLTRLPQTVRPPMVFTLALLPWLHQTIRWRRAEFPVASREIVWFWLVALLIGVWCWCECQRRRSASETQPAESM